MSLCKTSDPKGRVIFDPLDDATYQISKALALYFKTRRFLKFFPLVYIWVYVKQVTHRGGVIFDPMAIIWTIMVEVH